MANTWLNLTQMTKRLDREEAFVLRFFNDGSGEIGIERADESTEMPEGSKSFTVYFDNLQTKINSLSNASNEVEVRD
jgi:hypothetical protein